jgi:2,3-bisphosphoglycerate-independent phosphoglycerate mutase
VTPHDDRLPVVLVVLDGLGDRPLAELGGRTPAEAAATPVLDAFATRGASGWHVPFGWGRAPTSEVAHWAMFGFSDVPFPGRAVLEALGAGIPVARGAAVTFAALRSSRREGDRIWITGRAGRADSADARALLGELDPVLAAHAARLQPIGERGEALLTLAPGASGALSDSDPFFEELHPWLRVRATAAHAHDSARDLNALLLEARAALLASPVNAARAAAGRPVLDVLTTKWSGTREPIPTFAEHTGVAGGMVTGTGLYRGLAAALGMSARDLPPGPDLAGDLRARLALAGELVLDGARVVHVHSKATDDAGHTKLPRAKLEAIEAADAGLAGLLELADRAIVAVTGDHATPSTGGVLHTGDPTPLVLAGPTVRADEVLAFGEGPTRHGWYGAVRAAELLALLLSHANRPALMGHRLTPRPTLALPDDPEAMPAG